MNKRKVDPGKRRVKSPLHSSELKHPKRTSSKDVEVRSVIEKVRAKMRCGQFDEGLREQVETLEKILGQKFRQNDLNYLKGRCLIAEFYDYYGSIDKTLDAVREGDEIYRHLLERQKAGQVTKEERDLIREQIRFLLDFAQAKFYRKEHDYNGAAELMEKCLDLVVKWLRVEDDYPCYGTIAQIQYFLGRAYRHTDTYKAEQCFATAIDYFYKRGERQKQELKATTREEREKRQIALNFVNYKATICAALGLGWISYTRGHLTQAIHHLLPARVWLLQANDPINTAYVSLIQGSVLRARNGAQDMDKALVLLKEAYDAFQENGHHSYTTRAIYELALTYLEKRDTANAEAALAKLNQLVNQSQPPDPRWQCNVFNISSRIKRILKKDYPGARDDARKALKIAKDSGQTIGEINARSALSAAHILLDEYQEARKQAEEALRLNGQGDVMRRTDESSNPRIKALCNLLLARAYAKEGDAGRAEFHYHRWTELQKDVEHANVHRLGKEVEKEIKEVKDEFRITAEVENLKYKDNVKKLQAVLVNQARRRIRAMDANVSNEEAQIISMLDISRQTLYEWKNSNELIKK